MHLIDLTQPETEELCVGRIVLMSGIRPAKRQVDRSSQERSVHGFLYIWDGEVEFVFEDMPKVVARSGDLVFIPKGSRYTMRYTAESTTFVLVNFLMFLIGGAEATFTDRVAVVANDLQDHRIAGIMAKLEMCSGSENSTAVFRRKELFYRLVSVAFRDSGLRTLAQAKHEQIVPGVLLLQQSYLENIPITEFARVCKMSISSFRRQFAEVYGLSPVQYRNRLRIERARSLLSDGNCTVSEAALASGFENLGYFCRHYKKLTGETPLETRKNEG